MHIKVVIRYFLVLQIVLIWWIYELSAQRTSLWQDEMGNPYPSALSGGFQAPQFSPFDLDGDKVPEIISFDRYSGIPQVWKKKEEIGVYILTNDIDLEWPVLHSWMLVRDFNGDGLPDIFTQGNHGIAVYRGKKEGRKIVFEPMRGVSFLDDSLIFHNRSGGTTNIYHAATDIPIIEDVDGDGDLDILTFELSGTYLYFYENRAEATGNPLDYVLQHNCWGYFAENLFNDEINLSETDSQCPPPFTVRHAGSTSCLVDYDYNGTMDLILGDIGSGFLKVLLNGGTETEAYIEKIHPEFPHNDTLAELPFFPAAFRIDVDGDSVSDVVVAGNEFPTFDQQGVWWYRGTSDPEHPFHFQTREWLIDGHIDLGHYTAPLFFDVNADGIPDLLIGYQFLDRDQETLNRIAYFEAIDLNTYRLKDMDFESLSTVLTRGYRPYLTSGDVNGDGAEDILIGMSDGSSYLLVHGGFPGQPFSVGRVEADWAGLRLRSGATPELFDVDGDGDLDVIAGMDNGLIGVWVNTGNQQLAQFNPDLNSAPNINMLGNVRTVGSNSLLGRSAPRIILDQGDTILLSGSHEGALYAYHFSWENRNATFATVEPGQWPEWVGGNGRLTIRQTDDRMYQVFIGNIAGGLVEKNINMLSTQGDKEVLRETEIKLFPNPVRSGEAIHVNLADDGKINQIKVSDPSGRLYKTWVSEAQKNYIRTSSWPPGLYILEIGFKDRTRSVHKVVVY